MISVHIHCVEIFFFKSGGKMGILGCSMEPPCVPTGVEHLGHLSVNVNKKYKFTISDSCIP